MKYKRIDGPTPSGGAYSEIYYFSADGKNVDEDTAERCVIRECSESGELINEIWGSCK